MTEIHYAKEALAYIFLSTADEIEGQTGSVFTVHLEAEKKKTSPILLWKSM